MRRASAAARSAMEVMAAASVTVGGRRAGRCCMHTGKHKAQHHPLFVRSLCSPIKFFIGLTDPISAGLGVLVWFYFSLKSLSS